MKLNEIKLKPLLNTLKLEDIDDSVYFSKRYSGYVSNSRLSLINPKQGGTPEKYFEGLSNNKIYSDSLIFGSAVHELVLQPESFELIDTVNRPTAKCGFIADLVYKSKSVDPSDDVLLEASKEINYYKGDLSDNQLETLRNKILPYLKSRQTFELSNKGTKTPIYLDQKSRDRLASCLASLQNNNKIVDLLHPKDILGEDLLSKNERTILLDLEASAPDHDPIIIKLKSKLDNFTIDKDQNIITVNDVKTTGKRVNEFNNAIEDYHYYREMGMYSYLLSLCANKYWDMKSPTIKSNFLVVSTIPKFYTKVVPMTKKLFYKGFNEFSALVKLVAYYLFKGYTYK